MIGTEQIVCKKCGTVFRSSLGRFARKNKHFPQVMEVGFKCVNCATEGVGYYISKSLRVMSAKLQVMDTNSFEYRNLLEQYQKKFRKYNSTIGSRIRRKE